MTYFRKRALAVQAVAVTCGIGLLTACGGGDESYPSEEITYVVPYGAGGSTDPLAREYAQGLEEQLGVTVSVENREGASGTIGTSHALSSPADGYVLGQATNAVLAQQPLLNEDLNFSSPDDYHVISKLAYLPTLIAVPVDSPYDTLEEFLDYAEDNPGELQVSQAGAMTGADIALQELMALSGLDIQSVPFSSGGGDAYLAAVSGRVDATAGYTPGLAGFVESGDLKIIGVLSDEQYEPYPEAQTITDAGYETTYQNVNYAFAPKDLPDDVAQALDEASREVMESESMQSFAADNGYVIDPLGNEEAEEELRDFGEQFEEINEFIDSQ